MKQRIPTTTTLAPHPNVAAAALACLAIGSPITNAQEVSPLRIEGDQIHINVLPAKTTLEMSDSLEGPWTPVMEEAPEPRDISLPLNPNHAFFRLRVDGLPLPASSIFPDGFFADDPFQFTEAVIRDLDEANPLLCLTLAPGVELGENGLNLAVGDQIVRFSVDEVPAGAAVPAPDQTCVAARLPAGFVDIGELEQSVARLRGIGGTIPVFGNRGLIEEIAVPEIDFQAVRQGAPLTLFPFGRPPGQIPPPFPPPGPVPGSPNLVLADHSLLVTNVRVVEDPQRTFDPCSGSGTPLGKWTFGYLMEQMANTPLTGIPAPEFTRRWIRHWEVDQTINFDLVPERQAAIRSLIIDPWVAASGGPDQPLDLAIAPFRLCAIVNRIDLGGGPVGYSGGDAGELRFVYCAVNAEGRPIDLPGDDRPYGQGGTGESCPPLPFLVIFEYGVPISGCEAIKNWAHQWLALQGFTLGSPAYNAALEAITEQVVVANAAPSKPNGSALNQLRSNEILIRPWDLREWVIFDEDSDAHHLREVTTKQTPDFDYLTTNPALVASYVNTNEPAILAGSHVVPLTFSGLPFLSGHAPIDPDASFHWNPGGIANNNARHEFSLATCNACHGGETATDFTHISERPAGAPSTLSGFLTGIIVSDPVDGTPRAFDDLTRRAAILDARAHMPCFVNFFQPPVLMEH